MPMGMGFETLDENLRINGKTLEEIFSDCDVWFTKETVGESHIVIVKGRKS